MISTRYKFIFIHVPKTAGNSIQAILKQYSEDKINNIKVKGEKVVQNFYVSNPQLKTSKHSPLNQYYYGWKKEFGDIDQYIKFGTIRNPWDRAISYYFFRSKDKRFNKKSFLNSLTRQSMFNFFQIDGKLDEIDYFIRFENIQSDYDIVCDKIGIPRTKLPKLNKTKHESYTKYYDKEMIEIVAKKYKDDLKNFGYKFGE